MLYDWSMESNYSTSLKGNLADVVCARVGGANATPYLNSAVHFAKQKIIINFMLLQNTKFSGEFLKSETPRCKTENPRLEWMASSFQVTAMVEWTVNNKNENTERRMNLCFIVFYKIFFRCFRGEIYVLNE